MDVQKVTRWPLITGRSVGVCGRRRGAACASPSSFPSCGLISQAQAQAPYGVAGFTHHWHHWQHKPTTNQHRLQWTVDTH